MKGTMTKKYHLSSGRSHTRRPSFWAGLASAALLVAVLVPLLLISRYNHSYADDWHYGVWAHLALEDTGSLLAALAAAFEQVGKAWVDWQGTYTAIFLMAIEPSVFGEQYYVIAAPLIMGSLVAGSLFFWHVVICEELDGDRGTWVAVTCVTCALQLLLQPSAVEGIFWYNSAVYYTFFHALMLVYLGTVLRAVHPMGGHSPKAAMIWSAVLGALLAGGNFVTVLVSLELSATLLAVLYVRREPAMVRMLPAFCLLALGAMISFAAPGNSVRQQVQFPDAGLGVIDTIWQSSVSGFSYLAQWSGGLVALGMLALLPLILRTMSGPRTPRMVCRLPGLVSVASIALFATSYTPTFYSMGTVGPGRAQNARFDLLVVLLVLNMIWWCGWVCARRRAASARETLDAIDALEALESDSSGTVAGAAAANPAPEDATAAAKHVRPRPHTTTYVASRLYPVPEKTTAAISAAIVGILALSILAVGTDTDIRQDLSSLSASDSLSNGEAAEYDRQVWERIDMIESSDESEIEVPFYTAGPHVLFMGDIRDNMDNYINYRLAQWYRKDSIIGVHGSS
jgi:hypothetical protein